MTISGLSLYGVYGILPPSEYAKYNIQLEELRALEKKPFPKKQLADGIRYNDVMCSEDKVIMLKWTSNDLACVKEKTAIKLEERGWGIPKEKTWLFDTECGGDFTVFYEGIAPSKGKILKTIRMELSESDQVTHIQGYMYRWDHISMNINTDNSSFDLAIIGSVDENNEAKIIIDSLKEIPIISNVQFKGAWCF